MPRRIYEDSTVKFWYVLAMNSRVQNFVIYGFANLRRNKFLSTSENYYISGFITEIVFKLNTKVLTGQESEVRIQSKCI